VSRGLVAWITGLPSSGKSTLAAHVVRALGGDAVVLDGDAVRAAIVPPHGYDDAGRADFYETLARLAALVAGSEKVVLVPATAARSAFRDRARRLAPAFVEVFLDVPLEECARRDAKGLYAAGTAHLPGIAAPYERPEAADVVVQDAGPASVERVVRAIRAVRTAAG
jgi:adenylylsulfate kinase